MTLLTSTSAQARVGFFLGTQLGFGQVKLPKGFSSYVGGLQTAGNQDVPANTTVYRDFKSTINTINLALTAGVRLGFIAPDVRSRFFLGFDQSASRYTRSSTGLTAETGDYSYLLYTVEAGLRIYPFSFLYLRPYVGYASALNSFSFESYGSKKDNFRERTRAPLAGASVVFELGRTFPIDIGVDYSEYRSKFGGKGTQITLILGSTMFIGL